ncbi:MAG: ATP-binding cassette domain-containing protein [Granulosicoccus sp.]
MTVPDIRSMMPLWLAALFLVVVYCLFSIANGYTHFVFTLVAITTIVGVGLNILYGLTGLLSFGHIAFYAIGSYTCALLMLQGVNFFMAMLCSAILSGLAGLMFAVPAVRVKGAFLAMVTIAFAFVVEHTLVEWRSLTGGQNGLSGFPMISLGSYFFTERDLALLATGGAFLALLGYFRLEQSGWGLAMKGVRDAEIASASLGYHPDRVKTIAFGVSALLTGLAGAIYTPLIMFIAPSNFPFSQSILFLFSVILGGVATTLGPLFGAIITVMLPEWLSGLAQYRLLFFGGLMLAVLLIAPSGVTGLLSRMLPVKPRCFQEPNESLATDWLRRTVQPQALDASGLSISFGGIKAVNGVSFSVSSGKVLSIIGPNGAGKTTVLNIVSSFYKADAGSVIINQVDTAAKTAHEASRAGIARTYQTTRLYENMSVLENVLSGLQKGRLGHPFSRLDSPVQTALAIGLLRFSGYTGEPAVSAGSLPHVDRRFVEVARALATAPSVILLDEPAAGLMRTDKDALSYTIKKIADVGIAVVLVEHDMTLVMDISDEVLVLDGGEPIALGRPESVRQNASVIAAYLGDVGFSAPGRASPYTVSSSQLLHAEQLTAGYGAAPVLKQVTLEVKTGELVAILGANGAGKSTLMSVLTGLTTVESGCIRLRGEEIQQLAPHEIVNRGLVLVPEGRQVFPELTVRQNIRLGAYSRANAIDDSEVARLISRFPRLENRLDSQAGLLSGGEQQMMAIARGLMARPAVLLMDEPSLGLSPSMISELYLILAQLRDEGVTILLVDQMAHMALDVADRAYVLEQGRVVAEGTCEEIRKNGVLTDAYLGSSKSGNTINLSESMTELSTG